MTHDKIEEIVQDVKKALQDNLPLAVDKEFPVFTALLRDKITTLVEVEKKQAYTTGATTIRNLVSRHLHERLQRHKYYQELSDSISTYVDLLKKETPQT